MPEGMLPILREVGQVPGLLKEIYGDLAKPGVAQVGKALGAVLGLGNTVLWPIILLNEKARIALEANLEKYRASLEEIAPEDVTEVRSEIGVPIAEKLSYVTDEHLSGLYVALLASASTFTSANVAHPSFVNLINNLSPDEAVLLRYLEGELPVLRLRLQKKCSPYWLSGREELLSGLEVSAGLSFPQNIAAYLANFEGLGIVEIRTDIFLTEPPGIYEELKQTYANYVEQLRQTIPATHEPVFKEGMIRVTPYGQLFRRSCLSAGWSPRAAGPPHSPRIIAFDILNSK